MELRSAMLVNDRGQAAACTLAPSSFSAAHGLEISGRRACVIRPQA
jgi:hypothetical protein